MNPASFSQDYFTVFELPRQFDVDRVVLGERFRALQQELHPDRFAAADAAQQRVAVQYSSFVNEAYNTLRRPLARALYLLQLAGMDAETVSRQKVDGGFLMEQMELREKLEGLDDLVDPGEVIEHLLDEIRGDIRQHASEFATAYTANDIENAASAVVKMQYLDKLMQEAEQAEASLLD